MTQEKKNNALRNNVIFIVAVLGVLGLLYAISGERSNRLPEDKTHIYDLSPADCLKCHGPGMVTPRSEKHPPKDDCLKCHKRKKGVKALPLSAMNAPSIDLNVVKDAAINNSAATNSPSPQQ